VNELNRNMITRPGETYGLALSNKSLVYNRRSQKPQKPNEIPVPGKNPEIIPTPEPEPDVFPSKEPEIQPEKEPLTTPPSAPPEIPKPPQELVILNSFLVGGKSLSIKQMVY
jgi:hypothetical protein